MESSWARRLATLLATGAFLSGSWNAAVRGDDFRILNRVYVGDSSTPASETTTLFHGGLVYDCVDRPEEIVVFDSVGARFVLLDPRRKIRAEILTEHIDGLGPAIRKKLLKRSDAFSAFLADPKFDREIDAETGEVIFRSPWINYRIKSRPAKNETVAKQYASFSSYYTRFNTLKHPSLLARAPINAWLNQQQAIPKEVQLTTYQKGLLGVMTKVSSYRSEHIVTWGLSSKDLRRIEEIATWLVEFRPVRLKEYWNPKQRAANRE